MRYLIAQGPGYYGVNIQPIEDVAAGMAVERYLLEHGGGVHIDGNQAIVGLHEADGTSLILTPADMPGFDTGWWEEGEQALMKVLEACGIPRSGT